MHTPIVSKFIACLSAAFLAVIAFAVATPGKAQTAQLRVNVPFSFESGNEQFAPGVYNVHLDGSSRIIRIEGQKSSAFQMVMPDSAIRPSDTSKLVFHRLGSQYILKEIWVAGSTSHVHTYTSKKEKEMEVAAARDVPQSNLALLASAH